MLIIIHCVNPSPRAQEKHFLMSRRVKCPRNGNINDLNETISNPSDERGVCLSTLEEKRCCINGITQQLTSQTLTLYASF